MKNIFTKILKSKTLMFNWFMTIATFLFLAVEQYFPMLKNEIDVNVYVGIMIFTTVVNKILRNVTDKPLSAK